MKRNIITLFAFLFSLFTYADGVGYRNPILNMDVPDMALCHANGYYYMVSTTMHLMPGGPIMRSKDMKTWETVSYVFDSINDGDRYNLINNKTVYGQGQWASSIRYHNGKFYVWFTVNGAPGKGFVFSADRAEGPWTLIARPPHHHDASLFFDDDGKVYLFHDHGAIQELQADLQDVKKDGLSINPLFERDAEEQGALLEGSQVFKHKGRYYLCMISMKWGVPGRYRREVCYRADSLTGPWEKHVIIEAPFEEYGGVGQGCIVNGNSNAGDLDNDEDESNWWALMFQDRGGIGRVPCLLPCTWVDGWPMLGEYVSGDPLDKNSYRIPHDTSAPKQDYSGIVGSDEFDKNSTVGRTTLLNIADATEYKTQDKTNRNSLPLREGRGGSLFWQWNHNPINDAWSLSEREGWLRLKTSRIVDNAFVAPNTITQRMTENCRGEVCIDISKMKDGDRCGLAAFNGDSGFLTVCKENGKLTLVLTEEKSVFRQPRDIDRVDTKVLATVNMKKNQKTVWLRVNGDFRHQKDVATFGYSLDGKRWTDFPDEVKVPFDYRRFFMGTKFAIFNYATKQLGGYVDVDYFHYSEL